MPAKQRKELARQNDTMSDYLTGATIRTSRNWSVSTHAVLTAIYNQNQILEGVLTRFESALFDIRVLIQADLPDDELSAAEISMDFARGAGAVAGVVLEAPAIARGAASSSQKPRPFQLSTMPSRKKTSWTSPPGFIRHLGDIRNKCDHKGDDPTRRGQRVNRRRPEDH